MGQLTIDGREEHEAVSVARLAESQRAIMRHIGMYGHIRSIQAGVIVHQGREDRCSNVGYVGAGCCRYASSDGCDAMKRLMARGVVKRGEKRGTWVATR